jgi:hypothetical protein
VARIAAEPPPSIPFRAHCAFKERLQELRFSIAESGSWVREVVLIRAGQMIRDKHHSFVERTELALVQHVPIPLRSRENLSSDLPLKFGGETDTCSNANQKST